MGVIITIRKLNSLGFRQLVYSLTRVCLRKMCKDLRVVPVGARRQSVGLGPSLDGVDFGWVEPG